MSKKIRVVTDVERIEREIENYERMRRHAAERLAELEARHETDPKKKELLNHFKVRLRGDMESFSDQIGLLECEKEGLES